MSALERSYAHCRRVARARARNFYYSFLLLSTQRRDAMSAIYALMRQLDDIADDHAIPPQTRRDRLEDWRHKLGQALDGDPRHDNILVAFSDAVERYSIPHEYFFDLLDGMTSDLSPPEYESFRDLSIYCHRAASVVGMATIHVFGFRSEAALDLAADCGTAFQLTNIMRDVADDAAMGRVYLPTEELADCGLSRQEFLDGSIRSTDGRFQKLMELQWKRAERYYRASADLAQLVRPASRPALWAMVSTYRTLLDRIRDSRFDVLRYRVSLPVWRKLWIATRAFHLRATGKFPPFPS